MGTAIKILDKDNKVIGELMTATTSDISYSIMADTTKTDIEKVMLGFQIQSIWNNVVLNLEYIHINNVFLE